jgi:exopolyphosphatase/pppGpp-phosphohydrolase
MTCCPEDERRVDPLLRGAQDYNQLRAREPRHAADLIEWVQRLIASTGLPDDSMDRRLQDAACLLSDIGWRAHPDYRGEQSLNVIAHAAFSGVDHAGRAFLALTVFIATPALKSDRLVRGAAAAADAAPAGALAASRKRLPRRLSALGRDARHPAACDAGLRRQPAGPAPGRTNSTPCRASVSPGG